MCHISRVYFDTDNVLFPLRVHISFWICILPDLKGIILLHLRYIELYSYFITFVWFLLYENVNCVLFVSPPLNAILYYVLPHRNISRSIWRPSF